MDADLLIENSDWRIDDMIINCGEFDILCSKPFDSSIMVLKNNERTKSLVYQMCKYIEETGPSSVFASGEIDVTHNDHRYLFRNNRADEIFKSLILDLGLDMSVNKKLASSSSCYSGTWAIHFDKMSDDQKFVLMKNFNKIISED